MIKGETLRRIRRHRLNADLKALPLCLYCGNRTTVDMRAIAGELKPLMASRDPGSISAAFFAALSCRCCRAMDTLDQDAMLEELRATGKASCKIGHDDYGRWFVLIRPVNLRHSR